MWSHPSISFIGLRPRRWKWSFFFEHSLRLVSSVFISEEKNWGFPSLGASAFDQFYQSSSNKPENFEFFLQQKSSSVAFASEAILVKQPSSAEQRFEHVETLRKGNNLRTKVRPPYTFTKSWPRSYPWLRPHQVFKKLSKLPSSLRPCQHFLK